MPAEGTLHCDQFISRNYIFTNLTKDKGQAISVVDAPAEDAIGHAPVGGGEDLGNQGATHRSEEGEVSVENRSAFVEKTTFGVTQADKHK